jgi:hypothetical protein
MTRTSTDTASIEPQQPGSGDEPIVARAGRYYRNTRYLVFAALLLLGPWFARDGWVTWPREAQLHRANPKTGAPHSDLDIWFQKFLAITLPAAGIGLLVRTLYQSRGAYRLQGDVLSVPGHPDVPLDAIRQMDKSRWDKKGIAWVHYELPTGAPRALALDDFIYDRPPTDRIVERIETHLAQSAAPLVGDDQTTV